MSIVVYPMVLQEYEDVHCYHPRVIKFGIVTGSLKLHTEGLNNFFSLPVVNGTI